MFRFQQSQDKKENKMATEGQIAAMRSMCRTLCASDLLEFACVDDWADSAISSSW